MVGNSQSKDTALEALDFIINVLKEHEKNLDNLIGELSTVGEQNEDAIELNIKIDRIEERINVLQIDLTNMVRSLLSSFKEVPAVLSVDQATPEYHESTVQGRGSFVTLRCACWEDFQTFALKAQTVSFFWREGQEDFQVDVIKDNRLVTYSGELPKFSCMMKTWLAKQFDVSEKNILEGTLTIG